MTHREKRSRRSVYRSIDWTPAHIVVVVLGILTSGLHVSVGLLTGEIHFILMGGGLFAGVVVFFTVFWEPVLYLIGVVYVGALLTIWVLDGMQLFVFGFVDGLIQLALILTFLYLFVLEHREQAVE